MTTAAVLAIADRPLTAVHPSATPRPTYTATPLAPCRNPSEAVSQDELAALRDGQAEAIPLSFEANAGSSQVLEPWGAVGGANDMRDAIEWNDGVLYAAWGSGLRIFETEGEQPTAVGAALLPIQVGRMALRRPHLYILGSVYEPSSPDHHVPRLVVVDVSDASHPTVVGSYDDLAAGNDVEV